jgi:urea transport system ATP-binding protein
VSETFAIELEDVSAGYGETVVLEKVRLALKDGETVSVIGRNGVGKTTLVKTVIGLLRPRRGQVLFEDQDITRLPPNARARLGIGYVPQGRLVFPQLTVQDNLRIGQEALRAGQTSGLDDVLELFPVLAEMRDRLAGALSGGQQQQLAIGRALIGRPKLLLLDEPTEGIQPSIVLEIRRVLRRIRDQTAVAMLLAEQFLDFATGLADEYCVLDGGVVALASSAAALDKAAVHELLAV